MSDVTLSSASWMRLLKTLERIASSLEAIVTLVEKAAEDEAVGGGEAARLQASYDSGLKKGLAARVEEGNPKSPE